MGSILPRKRNDGTTGYTAMLRIRRDGKTKTQVLRTIQAQPQTVGNYMSHLASVFNVASPAWGYLPVLLIS